jgi:2-polyprenyl-3-methyl-5-hydroxy-6-metoxy-1,4-benzoquinol methylase
MDVRPGDHVLDIGCGGGMAIKQMAKIAVDGFVAGVDHSEIMVQQALRCNAANRRPFNNYPCHCERSEAIPEIASSLMLLAMTSKNHSTPSQQCRQGA